MSELNTYTYEDEDIGEISREEYLKDGKRVSGPDGYSVREYYSAEHEEFSEHGHNLKAEMWFTDNLLHRTDGPAIQEWHPNGSVKCFEYWKNGLMSREDGPAAIEYFESMYPDKIKGNILSEQWRQNDFLHRPDGPAFSLYHKEIEEQIAERQWWINGERRIEDGPAIERRNVKGEVIHELHWSKDNSSFLEKEYLNIDYSYWKNLDHLHDKENRNFALRLWHRWILGLEEAPDDFEFMYDFWLKDVDVNELHSRLAYFPDSLKLAKHVFEYKDVIFDKHKDTETIVRGFLQFIIDNNILSEYNSVIQQALSKEFTYVEMKPIASMADINIALKLNELYDSVNNSIVPNILSLTFHGYTYCEFAGFLFTQLLGINIDPWFQYNCRYLTTIVGPSGIVSGREKQ